MSKQFQFQDMALGAAAPIKLTEPAGSRGQELEILANVIVIEKRVLLRECLTACFRTALGPGVLPFPDVESWAEARARTPACLVVLSTGSREIESAAVRRDIELLMRVAGQLPIVLLADAGEPGDIIDALRQGAKGYIPTSESLKIAIEAMRLVKAGGVYAPANSLLNESPKGSDNDNGKRAPIRDILTVRQTEVLNALRKGKANKIIAYELNMRESTVKVHVRSIMRKFRATNRTEAAYMAQAFFNEQQPVISGLFPIARASSGRA